jgi:hypothetical protein
MAEPVDELAVMFQFTTVRFTNVELPESPYPLPMPDPSDKLLALMFPFTIVRFTTVELA